MKISKLAAAALVGLGIAASAPASAQQLGSPQFQPAFTVPLTQLASNGSGLVQEAGFRGHRGFKRHGGFHRNRGFRSRGINRGFRDHHRLNRGFKSRGFKHRSHRARGYIGSGR